MKLNRRVSLFFLIVFVGLLIPMSEVTATYTRWSKTSGIFPDPGWLVKVHELSVYLDLQNGKVQGIIDFTIKATMDFEEVYVDKAYLWVDTCEGSPKSWSKTYSTTKYNVKYGESPERHRFATSELSAGYSYSYAYSCTIWIRFVAFYDGILGPCTVIAYLAHRPLFFSGFNWIPTAASPYLEVFTSPPPNAPVYPP